MAQTLEAFPLMAAATSAIIFTATYSKFQVNMFLPFAPSVAARMALSGKQIAIGIYACIYKNIDCWWFNMKYEVEA